MSRLSSSQRFFRQDQRVLWVLGLILFLSVGLRWYGFRQPHGLTFDEGLYAELLGPQLHKDPTNYSTQEAYQALTARGERLPEYLNRPLFKHPPLYPYLIAFHYTLFGEGNASAAAVSIVLGSLMVGAAFFLGKALYDERVGILAALFLAVDPVHWICSEKIWMETTLSFLMMLGILFFVLGLQREKYLFLSGLATGLAMLTKYTGILNILLIGSFVLLWERRLFLIKEFWLGCLACGVIFMPWVLWNMAVYENFQTAFVTAHASAAYWKALMPKGAMILGAGLAAGGGVFLVSRLSPTGRKWITALLAGGAVAMLVLLPVGRAFVKDILTWSPEIKVGWSNPFARAPWYFYFQQLVKFSPLYIFSLLSLLGIPSRSRGDVLMGWCCVWILGFHVLWGNYQTRYILAAVPFLLILAARFLVWGYERNYLRTCLILLGLYFFIKTVKTGLVFAVGPDFGYF